MKYLKHMNFKVHLFEEFKKYEYKSDSIDFTISIEEYAYKICQFLNIKYDYIEVVGEGGYGIAIDLGDSILKITTDKSEAYYANILLNINSKNLVKIFNVKEVKSDYQYGELYIIHEEKLITNINSVINLIVSYLHKRNPIIGQIETVSDDDVYDYFHTKIFSLDRENILNIFYKIKNVYLECNKYNIPFEDFHGSNVGIRKDNPTELVYFDISDPYNTYNLNIDKIELI